MCVSTKPKYQTARTAEGGEDFVRKHKAEVPNAEQAFGEKCERRSHLGRTFGEHTLEPSTVHRRTRCVHRKPRCVHRLDL